MSERHDKAWAAVEKLMAERAAELIEQRIAEGAALYQRARDLPKLLGHRCLIMSSAEIVAALEASISASAKALAGNRWHRDFNRHLALRQALRAEQTAMANETARAA